MSETKPVRCWIRLPRHSHLAGIAPVEVTTHEPEIKDIHAHPIPAVAVPLADYNRVRAAVLRLVNEIYCAAKTDPRMGGGAILRGVDHPRWNEFVIPAIRELSDAIALIPEIPQ